MLQAGWGKSNWGVPIKVFGHLTQALAQGKGQVVIADQLLNGALPHAQRLQACQGLQQIGPQQPGPASSLGVIQKPARLELSAVTALLHKQQSDTKVKHCATLLCYNRHHIQTVAIV